jgi:hypothetical protein
MRSLKKIRLADRRGFSLVWLAMFLLILLLFFASLAIDISYIYLVDNELQTAADSACLAGVAHLSGNDLEQSDARKHAWQFACRNTAAAENVYLVTKGSEPSGSDPCDDIPNASALNSANNSASDDDIIVGNWDIDAGTFTPADGSNTINAMKIRARRTANSPGGQIELFLGKIFTLIGADWSFMSARSEATCTFIPPGIVPFPLCFPNCGISG